MGSGLQRLLLGPEQTQFRWQPVSRSICIRRSLYIRRLLRIPPPAQLFFCPLSFGVFDPSLQYLPGVSRCQRVNFQLIQSLLCF
jgi:hypothetical protein